MLLFNWWVPSNVFAGLTPRLTKSKFKTEFEVFCLLIAGLLNKQIAAELGAALRTIKRHRGSVIRKLDVQSVADLVRLAQKVGISPDPSSRGLSDFAAKRLKITAQGFSPGSGVVRNPP